MSDAKLRELERRWKESGAVEDEAAYLLERVRVGDLEREKLELAAYCDHPAARLALGGKAPAQEFGSTEWGRGGTARAGPRSDPALRRGPPLGLSARPLAPLPGTLALALASDTLALGRGGGGRTERSTRNGVAAPSNHSPRLPRGSSPRAGLLENDRDLGWVAAVRGRFGRERRDQVETRSERAPRPPGAASRDLARGEAAASPSLRSRGHRVVRGRRAEAAHVQPVGAAGRCGEPFDQ